MTRAILIAIICLCSASAFAQTGPEKLPDPRQEARAVALQKEFRCVVCQGESLDESNALLAADLRRLIRARIESGDTDAQIQRYLVSRYGSFILMKPPLEPDTYLLWFGPIALLGIGGAVMAFVVLRARNRLALPGSQTD
jgi:cytochrome c-type biogenesis protein CcmH